MDSPLARVILAVVGGYVIILFSDRDGVAGSEYEGLKMDQAPADRTLKQALVVEGGGMRGIFSTGVLDGFSDQGYRPFNVCLGVSAGSTNLAAWLSHQRGRNHKVITDYSCRPQFISFKRFLRGGHWLDLDWLWDITIREIRLDLATFAKQPIPLYVVTTKVADGQAAYIRATPENLEQLLKASCSVPIVYRNFTMIDGEPMTDGGVADSIPVVQAHRMGARDITVILSRPNGYRKQPPRSPWFLRRLLAKTPHLAEAMVSRAERYNQSIDFIENPPEGCRIRVIAPPRAFAVGRMTTDSAKLREGYEMGLNAARSTL
jgi:predicted patatin/cPLA2 family phospholipase